MKEKFVKYGGREFLEEEVSILRRLAQGEILTVMSYGAVVGLVGVRVGNIDTLLGLVNAGYAEDCTTKYLQTFRATPALYELKAIEDSRAPMTFDELAARMGRSFDKAACRKWKQKMRSHAKAVRVFPTRRDIYAIQAEVMNSPEYIEQRSVNEGEAHQFLNRKLTDWYVKRFCAANNLTQ